MTSSARRLSIALLTPVIALTALTACGDDEPEATETSVADTAAADAGTLPPDTDDPSRPPNTVAELQQLFNPIVEPMGLRVTRGALVDISDGYVQSDTGTHLALYVEPTEEAEATYDNATYIDGIYDLTALVTPIVFDTWPGVESYDICQEPLQTVDPAYEPFPMTQVELSRDAAAGYDFATGDLPTLVNYLLSTEGARLLVGPDLKATEEYQQVLEDSGFEPASASTPPPAGN